ncbi:MAG: hypothetical protein IJ260_08620 [Butyrivibrio sp.]|nr:hypothetical protein [Butyrivibrio sp.]MBR1670428.1 hypothetical protein [Butyrivibrio sp.]
MSLKIYERLSSISFSRPSGTDKEKEVASYLEKEIKQIGFEPLIESFEYTRKVPKKASLTAIYENGEERSFPVTGGLLSAIPVADPIVENSRERSLLEGDIPSPVDIPAGCKFASRCPYATADKKEGVPPLHDFGGGHYVQNPIRKVKRQTLIFSIHPTDQE